MVVIRYFVISFTAGNNWDFNLILEAYQQQVYKIAAWVYGVIESDLEVKSLLTKKQWRLC
jgi:hypothetical protein